MFLRPAIRRVDHFNRGEARAIGASWREPGSWEKARAGETPAVQEGAAAFKFNLVRLCWLSQLFSARSGCDGFALGKHLGGIGG
jgi:hypothetical protein